MLGQLANAKLPPAFVASDFIRLLCCLALEFTPECLQLPRVSIRNVRFIIAFFFFLCRSHSFPSDDYMKIAEAIETVKYSSCPACGEVW